MNEVEKMTTYKQYQKAYAKAYPFQISYSIAYKKEIGKFIKQRGRNPMLKEAQAIGKRIRNGLI
jgi:uncharacterized transporter YbjL